MDTDKLLSGVLQYLIPAGMGAAVSIITVQVSLGYVEKGFDDYKVSSRYQDELRDRASTLQYSNLLSRLERIENRMDREPKASLDSMYSYAFAFFTEAGNMYQQPYHKSIPELPPPERRLIFDDRLEEIKKTIDALALKQKEHKISDHEEDILMQAEQHYQRVRVWQAYCDPDPVTRDWCLNNQKRAFARMNGHRKWMVICASIAVVIIAAEVGFILGLRMYAPLMEGVQERLNSIDMMLFNTLPAPPTRSYAELVQKNSENIEKQGKQIDNVMEVARRAVKLMDQIATRQDKREARQVKSEKAIEDLENRLKIQENLEANRSTAPKKSSIQPGRK